MAKEGMQAELPPQAALYHAAGFTLLRIVPTHAEIRVIEESMRK